MAAPFTCDEQVSIEHLANTKDPVYGTQIQTWLTLHDHFWTSVQDVLPSRAEATGNGLTVGTMRARLRLRLRDAAGAEMTMRVKLHSRGDVVMQIVAGPARLDGTDFDEFAIESYSSNPRAN